MSATVPPTLAVAVALVLLAVLLPLGTLWELVAVKPSLAPCTADTVATTTQAANRVGLLLSHGMACSVQAAAPAGRAPLAGPELEAALARCAAAHPGLEQVFVLPTHPPDLLPDTTSERIAQARQTQTHMAALVPLRDGEAVPGIDLIVPLRGRAAPTVLLLRHRWHGLIQDAPLASLTASRSVTLQDGGPPDADTRQPACALALPTAPQVLLTLQPAAANGSPAAQNPTPSARQARTWVSVLTLSLLLAGGAGVLAFVRHQRISQRRLQDQVHALERKDEALRAEVAAKDQLAQARQQEADLREDIQESVSVGLLRIDPTLRLAEANQAFCRLSGFRLDQLQGQPPPYPFWPDAPAASALHLHGADPGGSPELPPTSPLSLTRPDGSRWLAQLKARPLRSGQGWIIDCSDVTAEIEAQRRMAALTARVRQQSAMVRLGEGAAELLHKMANHALACATACDNVIQAMDQQQTDVLSRNARHARDSSERMQDLVERFEPWLRNEPALAPAALRTLVDDAIALCSAEAEPAGVQLLNLVSDRLPPLQVDSLMMVEALCNLIRNAIRAMATVPDDDRRVLIESRREPGGARLTLSVRDTGTGLADEVRQRLFEQGASGAPDGHGWGLYSAREWMRQFGGDLALGASSEQGTTFVITLPLPATHPPEHHHASQRTD